jgi:hypothetical protein
MAASPHYRFKAGTLSWDPETGAAVTLLGAQKIDIGEGGETIDLMSDASELVQEQPLSGIKGRISITLLNQAHLALALGAGALTFHIERVKSGRGAVAGSTKSVTFSNATLKDKSAGFAGQAGESLTLVFDAAEDDGDIFVLADVA